MNNDKQYMQEINQVLNNYLRQAIPLYESCSTKDEFYSKASQIIKNDAIRYGETLIPACIVKALTIIKGDRPQTSTYPGVTNQYAADGIFTMQISQIFQMTTAVVVAFGERGIWKLFELLGTPDEDIATIAASCFDSEVINHPQIIPQLQTAYSRAEGSAYKFSIALQMMFYGDSSVLVKLSSEHNIAEFEKAPQLVIISLATDGNPYNSIASWRKNRH